MQEDAQEEGDEEWPEWPGWQEDYEEEDEFVDEAVDEETVYFMPCTSCSMFCACQQHV